MVKNIGRPKANEDDIDALFKLPLTEFTGARKTLAARLKKEGHADEAAQVAALAKPSVSAWTVNQLYWNHRDEFDQLIDAGRRFRRAQASRSGTKVADMRDALDARRQVLIELADLATTLLRDAGTNPSLETIRRVTTTLEALSAYEAIPDAGRLTKDVDPPGFESLASFVPGASMPKRTEEHARVSSSTKSAVAPKSQAKPKPTSGPSRLEETRQARIAIAKVSLQDAKKSLVEARAKVQSLETMQKKADADVKEAEKQRRDAEERLKKARAASDDAARRARRVSFDVRVAAKTLDEARLAVEKATTDLESLFRES